MKENKNNNTNRKEKQGKVWPVVLCLLLAGGIFAVLLNVEIKQLEQYEKGNVVIAIEDVSDQKEITQENLAEYFVIEERPLSDIPQAAYLELEDLVGQYAQGGIDAGSMVTKSMLGELTENYESAVLLGVNMEALEQSVAGTLRAGDEIDIYTVKVDEEDNVIVEKALGNVTIERSYTSAGVAIEKDDKDSIAQYITIPVHKDAVGTFYQTLEERRVEIVKHP